MKKLHASLLCLSLAALLGACGSSPVVADPISPNEEGGMGGDAASDKTGSYDTTKAVALLKSIAKNDYYTYEINAEVSGYSSHFTQFYSPNAFYEQNDDESVSIGYAQEKDTNALFKYYLNDDRSISPSTYEYLSGEKVEGLYGAFSVTNFKMISWLEDPTYEVVALSSNSYRIADTDIISIFQYSTSYGSSIVDYTVSVTIEILDEATDKFRSVISLGDYGSISAIYTKYDSSFFPNSDIESQIANGSVKGVDCYADVHDLFANKLSLNNYTLEGVRILSSTGSATNAYMNIVCTDRYFSLRYFGDVSYRDWGYAYIDKGQNVKVYEVQTDGSTREITYNLQYGACFEFETNEDGDTYFTRLIGPLETNYSIREVDALPESGSSDTLYVVSVEGNKIAYEWKEVSEGVFGFAEYSAWFNGIEDFTTDGYSASFYLNGKTMAEQGARLFEKSRTKEATYNCKDTDITSYLANGLFGWGFQSTTTWMDYISDAELKINKTGGEISSCEIGLNIVASMEGSSYTKQKAYYTYSNFGTSKDERIETFLSKYLGGEHE